MASPQNGRAGPGVAAEPAVATGTSLTLQLLPPTSRGIRGPDSYSRSGGGYGASRSRTAEGETVVYPHRGVDFVTVPGENVLCPAASELIRTGFAYKGDLRFRLVVLMLSEDTLYTIKILYLQPKDTLPGECYEMGDVIGTSQDLRLRYPADGAHPQPIVPHVHLELRHKGEPVDPTPYLVGAAAE